MGNLGEQVGFLWRFLVYGVLRQRPANPPSLIYQVTNRCTMRCRHCSQSTVGYEGEEMSLAELEGHIRRFGPVAKLGLGGGEPFLRTDLDGICELFARHCGTRSIGIPTNSFSPETICRTAESILARCPETKLNLLLSLDGFEATHDAIRGAGAYVKVLENARGLRLLAARQKRFTFYFNATVHSGNYRELPELARFVEKEFQTTLECNLLTGIPNDQTLVLPPVDEVSRTLDGIYAQRGANQAAMLRVFCDVRQRTITEGRQIIPCAAGSVMGLLFPDGKVYACALLPEIGNLRENSYQEIWDSPKAKKQWKSIRAGACSCNSDCMLTPSLMYYWRSPFLVLRERFRHRRGAAVSR